MRSRGKFPVWAALAMLVAAPSAGRSEGAVPELSGVWQHPAFPWFEPPASGPGPVTNLSRWELQFPGGLAGSEALPPSDHGISDYDQLVGDYKNPILQPWAAEVVKHFGEMSKAGITYGNPSNQCWPSGPPFIYKKYIIQLMQQKNKVTILYSSPDNEVRTVRMNAQHPNNLRPSWYGDSIGLYEGDALVVDTVGIKADGPYRMLDLFGTPYTNKLHVIERYRIAVYDEVKDAIERNRKENWLFNGDPWKDYHGGKYLQVQVTIDDPGVFTTPWTSTLTYIPQPDGYPESVCAENPNEYYSGGLSDIPKSDKPDF